MFETVSTDENKNGIEVKLVNRREEIPVTLTAATHAEFYIFLDVPTLKEIEMFFTAHLKHNKIDISYYLEQAKIKFLKYINLGLDYVVRQIHLFIFDFRKQWTCRTFRQSKQM